MTWDLKHQDNIIDFLHDEFFETWDNSEKGYAVFRIPQKTSELFNRTVTETFKNRGLDAPEIMLFCSKDKKIKDTNDIKDFVDYFNGTKKTKKPKAIFCIIDSIKQGITLDKSKIMMWVDRLNASTDRLLYDNIAMHAQSLGRNVGYDAEQYNYPVYGNYDAIMHHVNDIETLREAVLFNKKTDHIFCHTGANAKPTKNKHKTGITLTQTDIMIKDIIVCKNKEDMLKQVYNLQGTSRKSYSTCSNNVKDFSHSILKNNLNSHGTAVRDQPMHNDPTTFVTPLYMDNPSPTDSRGQNFNMLANTQWGDLRSKYIIILTHEVESFKAHTYDTTNIKNTLVLCS
jgi:hypothetical protein